MAPNERNTSAVQPMRQDERPISEQFRIVALHYVDADGAASLLEELKTTTLADMKTKLMLEIGDMPDSKAERIVKSTPEWRGYITKMVEARSQAHKLRLQLEFLRMKEREQDRSSWLQRTEHKMGRSTP